MPWQLPNLRLWLANRGLVPRERLALITWYLLGLDALLFLIEKLARYIRGTSATSLGGWVTFLSAVIIVLFFVLSVRWVSERLMWRLRNRLIVTYVFIGVIPLVLLISLGGLEYYLFAGQFATYIVTSRLNTELKSFQASNAAIAHSVAAKIVNGSKLPSAGAPESSTFSDRQLSVWINKDLWFNESGDGFTSTRPSLPTYLPAEFAFVVRDQGMLFLRAGMTMQTTRGNLTVVSSKPLDQRLLTDLASRLGEITLYASGLSVRNVDRSATPSPVSPPPGRNPSNYALDTGPSPLQATFTAGDVPRRGGLLDRPVNFPTAISVLNWANGDTSEPAAIGVRTRLSVLYDHLFAALGDFAPTIELFLLLAAIVFGVIELIALWIGTRLTRSVTGAVAQLYRATLHINRGNFSHRIPITSKDQIAALAGSFNLMTESIEKLILEQKEKQRLENEITIAQEVQSQLFPRDVSQLPGLEVHGFCRPARSVSGDYYDFLRLTPDRLALAVGDVSGKGISAALLMATIHSAVRAYSIEGIPALRQVRAVGAGQLSGGSSELPGAEVSPAILLSLLNHQLYHSTPMEKYATLFLGMYDGSERRITFSNAGHLPPLLLAESGTARKLEDGGTVVGLFEEATYDEGSVQLRPGDIFLAYSDGVTEPENEFGEFGEKRLIELVRENRDLPLTRITEIVTAAVDDWIGAAEQPDDVTLVLARAR